VDQIKTYVLVGCALVGAYYALPYLPALFAKVKAALGKVTPAPTPDVPAAGVTEADAVAAALLLHKFGCEQLTPQVCDAAKAIIPLLLHNPPVAVGGGA
jgi:hypothetical protein